MNAKAAVLIEQLQAETPDALRLARVASLAVRVERHLLRRLRLELLPGSDTGIEADLWFSSIIESRGSGSFVINADATLLLRRDLTHDSVRFERAVAITEAEHRYLPESIQLEERLNAITARGGNDLLARIDEALQPALRVLRAGGAHGKQVARWAMRALPRFDPVARGSKNALALLLGASAQLGGRRIVQDRTSWPLSANDVAWAIPPALLAKHIRIGLELADDAIRFVEDNGKTPVIELPQTTPLLVELNWRSQDTDFVYMVEAELGKWFQIDRGIGALTVRTIDGRAYVVEKRFTSQSPIDRSQTPGKPVCFVTMGFGVKRDYATGRRLDLDKSYRLLIKPVVEERGFTCVRADEIRHSGAIDVPMYQELLTADVVIADISTANANAIYELGIRHGLRPHATIVIAEKNLSYPFDLNHIVVLAYEHSGDDIGYDEVMRFRKLLGERLNTAVKDHKPDSPVYDFLPNLRPPSTDPSANVDLPDPISDTISARDAAAKAQLEAESEQLKGEIKKLDEETIPAAEIRVTDAGNDTERNRAQSALERIKDRRRDRDVEQKEVQTKLAGTQPAANAEVNESDPLRRCFVIMGFGNKTDYATGRRLDLDKSYRLLIKPAVEEKGITCIRADEIRHSGAIDVPMYQELLTADVVIADLSTANGNALYELGMRHALRPRTTIVISENKLSYPFDLNHIVITSYSHLGDAIDYDEVRRFRKLLGDMLNAALKEQKPDSPVYTFLPKLRPPWLDPETFAQPEAEDRLNPAQKAAPGEVKAAPALVYLMCDQLDRANVAPIQDFLFDQSLVVALPLFAGDSEQIREVHYQTLKECDGVLIFWGKAKEAWLRTMLSDMNKVFRLGRSRPYKAASLYLAELPDTNKESFRTRKVSIIRASREFEPALLRPFVAQLSGT